MSMVQKRFQANVPAEADVKQIDVDSADVKANSRLSPLVATIRALRFTSLLTISIFECRKAFSILGFFSRTPRDSLFIETISVISSTHLSFKTKGIYLKSIGN